MTTIGNICEVLFKDFFQLAIAFGCYTIYTSHILKLRFKGMWQK